MSNVTMTPFVPAALAFLVPVFGPLIALASPVLAARHHGRLWPGSRRRTALLAGLTVVTGIWVSLVLVPYGVFLLIPLCGPENLFGWLLPSAIAVASYGLVCLASVRRRNPWLWPLGAVVGAVAFSLTGLALAATGYGFIC